MRRARREQPKFSHSRAVERARLTPGPPTLSPRSAEEPVGPPTPSRAEDFENAIGRELVPLATTRNCKSWPRWSRSATQETAGGQRSGTRTGTRRPVSRSSGRVSAAALPAVPADRAPSRPARRSPPVTFGRAGPCAGPASPASCVDSAAVPAASTSSNVARAPYGRTRLRGASSARIAARRRPGRGGGGPCLGRYGAPDAARSPPRCAGTGGRALRRYERRAEPYDAIGANTRFEFPICPIAELDLPHPRYCRPRRVTPTVRACLGGGAHLS